MYLCLNKWGVGERVSGAAVNSYIMAKKLPKENAKTLS
jgi:hypothetical protein